MSIKLEGHWHKGLAYDLHTVTSVHLGADESGHDRYDNQRSEMGELVYRLKYKADKSALEPILALLSGLEGIETFDVLLPVPATNKNRPFQPVELITQALGAQRQVRVLGDALLNNGDLQTKSISDPVERLDRLKAAFQLSGRHDLTGMRVLLVDDLYRSGTTLNVLTDLLYNVAHVKLVSVLTMTKTRSNR
jgi:predicted amidophosphoribosyltransferase